MRPMILLVKSWVRHHTRRLPDGRVVQVAGHQDRRTRQQEANPHQLDLDLEHAGNPAGSRSSPNPVGAPPSARSAPNRAEGGAPTPPQDPHFLALLKLYAGDEEVTPKELREAVRQYREVESRYRGTPQWLKAPNGQPTKLNERQWVLVRTPNFKRWFGDWDGLAQQQRMDRFIDAALADPVAHGTLVLRAVTPEERAEVLRQGGPDLTGMEHVLDAQELRHAMKSHGGPDEGSRQPGQRPLTTDDLKRIAAVLDAPDELTVQPRQTNRTSIIYGRAFLDGKTEYVERVFETSTKHKPRLVTKTVWVKAAAGVESSPTRVSAPYRNTSLAFSGGRINPDTVSKVVDPNGEPLVVYHSTTRAGFSVFHADSHFGTLASASQRQETQADLRERRAAGHRQRIERGGEVAKRARNALARLEAGESLEVGAVDALAERWSPAATDAAGYGDRLNAQGDGGDSCEGRSTKKGGRDRHYRLLAGRWSPSSPAHPEYDTHP